MGAKGTTNKYDTPNNIIRTNSEGHCSHSCSLVCGNILFPSLQHLGSFQEFCAAPPTDLNPSFFLFRRRRAGTFLVPCFVPRSLSCDLEREEVRSTSALVVHE